MPSVNPFPISDCPSSPCFEMCPLIGDICYHTRDLINLIDATMVEIVLYARGDTMLYADESALKKQILVQAQAITESIAELDALIGKSHEFLETAKPPENVPGQVLAISEVIVNQVQRFNDSSDFRFNDFFRALPIISRHELMERLRAYRDYMFRAAGLDRPGPDDSGFSTEPLAPYWW